MQICYAFEDLSDAENEREIKHCGNMRNRMRETLWEWSDPFLEKLAWGDAVSEDQACCNRDE